MNQRNFDYLSDQVKYTGFGEDLEKELKKQMEKQKPAFTLTHRGEFGSDRTSAELHFKKSSQSDMYFFNSYRMKLQKAQESEPMSQIFYINKSNNVTMKEAYNLMSGRAVNKDLTNKEGQLYNAWIQMNFGETTPNGNYKFKRFHQNYGYDLEKALAQYPIKELNQQDNKTRLMNSLKKGNLQAVTFREGEAEQKHYIEANPYAKTINVYDGNQQRLNNRQAKKEALSKGEGKTVKKEDRNKKQNVEEEEPEMPKKAKKRRKRKAKSIS